MAPEFTAAESDVDYEGDAFDASVIDPPRNLTKATDVYAFSMVALEVSDLLCV
jgi:hypothetical protein